MLQKPWQVSYPRLTYYHAKHLGFWLGKRCQEGSHTFLSCCFHLFAAVWTKWWIGRKSVFSHPFYCWASLWVKNLLFNNKDIFLRTMEICSIARATFILLTKSGQKLILPLRRSRFACGWWNQGPGGAGGFVCLSLPRPRPSWCPHPDLEKCRRLEVKYFDEHRSGGGAGT